MAIRVTTSPPSSCQSGDVGTIFEITSVDPDGAAVDISAATVKKFHFKRPDGTTLTKTAVFTSDGSDGKLRYTTVADDLNQPGTWQVQVHVEAPSYTWHSSVAIFQVKPNLVD